METKVKIIKLLKATKRDGIDDLIKCLNDIGYFTAPCSGGNHLCKMGGLAEHSLNVCETAKKLCKAWGKEELLESVTIAALLHDVGKCGDYEKAYYVDNMLKTGLSKTKPFKRNPDLLEKNHAFKSVVIVNRWFDLTEDEEFAIIHHDGLYEYANKEAMQNPTVLLMIIHFSDLWCSREVEIDG